MKEYTVVPDRDVTGWDVTLEDTAPVDHFEMKSDAIEFAEKMAKENKPSKLIILDQDREVVEKREF
ncbi:DUF2188 domain-containing protein [Pseudalkalibacillus sp. SCS-8]|uniref:DUF2188 domain-containing protein n=1 Tax=Pseudalkalibacillus nanhaiensis TaxID=3115291 RepID=UPI0032DB7842